jgi:hypothetical protein
MVEIHRNLLRQMQNQFSPCVDMSDSSLLLFIAFGIIIVNDKANCRVVPEPETAT